MAPRSSTLTWKISWTEEPGGLQSMGSLSRTGLSYFTFTFHFRALEKEMATHSSVLAWRIPGTGEPGGLPSMGSHRVGHDWSDLAAAAAAVSNHGVVDGLEQMPGADFSTHWCLEKNFQVKALKNFVLLMTKSFRSLLSCQHLLAESVN